MVIHLAVFCYAMDTLVHTNRYAHDMSAFYVWFSVYAFVNKLHHTPHWFLVSVNKATLVNMGEYIKQVNYQIKTNLQQNNSQQNSLHV